MSSISAPAAPTVPAAAAAGSLYRELAAYEALWLRPDASVRSVATAFAGAPARRPSEIVSEAELVDARDRLGPLLADPAVRSAPFTLELSASSDYPVGLADAQHPVPALYRRGDRALFSSAPRVAIIGSREASADGLRRAARLARGLVAAGVTVVSGLARGIDTAALVAAIEAGGRVIAVIGTSILDTYPRENAELQRRIGNDHLLVSQVPILRYRSQNPRTNSRWFPERNATMSALSHASVIVEAADRSGTLTQAKAARFQHRTVYALESLFSNPSLSWPAQLEQRGARRLGSVEDLLRALPTPSDATVRTS